MGKLLMVAGRQIGERIGAYVVLSAGRMSRVFSVRGTTTAPTVTELPAATTIDMGRFDAEIEKDLRAEAGDTAGGAATRPKEALVSGAVKAHLKRTESLDVD